MTAPASPSLDAVLAHLRERIDAALDALWQPTPGCPARLNDAIRYSLLAPGKRLRPILVLLAADACGSDDEAAMPAACAIEMVHCYSLIHDDLPAMDDDDLRRGRPTCHRQFDEATAILAGDALLARAFETLARDVQPAETAARCCAELGRAAGATQLVGGQADDLAGEIAGGGVDRLEAIHARKTGAMFSVALRLGGIIGGADGEQLAALQAYSEKLGLAFQITDDLLDIAGNEADLGKRVGKDADHGKITFPGLLGEEASRRLAGELIDGACAALSPLAPRHGTMEDLARLVLMRKN